MDKMVQTQILREHLISVCRRSARNFRRISETAREEELKRVFRLFSQQRQEFVDELLQCGFPLNDFGETTESIPGLRRQNQPDTQTQLNSISEREEEALRLYIDALEGELPGSLKEVVGRQRVKIQESFEYIQDRIHFYQPQKAAVGSRANYRF